MAMNRWSRTVLVSLIPATVAAMIAFVFFGGADSDLEGALLWAVVAALAALITAILSQSAVVNPVVKTHEHIHFPLCKTQN